MLFQFWRNFQDILPTVCTNLHSHNIAQRFCLLHFLNSMHYFFVFLVAVTVMGMGEYFPTVLTWVSLTSSQTFFMGLLGIFLFKIFFHPFILSLVDFVYVHVCHHEYVEVRGQFVGVGAILLPWSGDWAQVVRLGGWCLFPMSHLVSPFKLVCFLRSIYSSYFAHVLTGLHAYFFLCIFSCLPYTFI